VEIAPFRVLELEPSHLKYAGKKRPRVKAEAHGCMAGISRWMEKVQLPIELSYKDIDFEFLDILRV
jgi:hypothetical protein